MMLKYICLLLSVSIIVDGTIPVGLIDNAAYITSGLADVFSYSNSCDECTCYAFFSNISINYQALNCYQNNRTCLLFRNYLSKSLIRIQRNSIFLYQLSETTTNAIESVTTSAFQCYVPQWNTTGIVFATDGSNFNQIHQPYGIFIAANSDTLFIADTGNNRILKWLLGDTTGTLVAGGLGAGSSTIQLNYPVEVCVDINENMYVADTGNYRIQYFDHGSTIGRTIAGNGTHGSADNLFGLMFGLGVDLANNVYASEYDNARVTKWSPNSTHGILVAGNGAQGNALNQLNIPTAFYVDPNTGTLYIPNQGSHCITKWLPGSSSGSVVAGICGVQGTNETLFTTPECVTFDKYGNMYVSDLTMGGRIMMFCPDSSIGIPIITSGLNNPISIAVDTHLNLYVSDWSNQRIMKYTLL